MKEIKYRVWDNEGKEMLEVVSLGVSHDWPMLVFKNGLINGLDSDDYIVEQYTGLKDKNGTEIYEGDIIAQHIKNDEYMNIKEVKFGCFEDPVDYFNYDGVGFYAVGNDGEENGELPYMIEIADFEVISNIHEHSHLLERD